MDVDSDELTAVFDRQRAKYRGHGHDNDGWVHLGPLGHRVAAVAIRVAPHTFRVLTVLWATLDEYHR